MKILKKLLYLLLGLLSLLSIFIIICAFNPQLSDSLSNILYPEKTEENMEYEPEEILQNPVPDTKAQDEPEFTEDSEVQPEVMGYVPPEKEGIEAPKEVDGRNGYIPIQESSEQIDEEEAERLRNQITYGETGDDLSFDSEFYPYYAMLDPALQKLYRQVYANAVAVNGIFTPIEPVSPGQLRNVFMAVFNDHPEIFWLDTTYRGKFTNVGICAEIILQFNQTVDNLEKSKAAFNGAADNILQNAPTDGDYEQEVYIHKALLDGIEYNLQSPLNQSAYSALVNGQTVCAGYARAFQYLMQQLKVPCYYATGYAGQNHAWNIIRLDNEYYNVDVTWNDTEPNTFNYFNKTDADFAGTHIREELSVNLPPCNGQKYSNLETNEAVHDTQENDSRKTPEEAGVAEEVVLTTLQDYYNDCYNRIIESGGSVQFQNVVIDESLWIQCYNAYDNDEFGDAYMNQILSELNAVSCDVDIWAEELQNGCYVLNHTINIWQ